MRLISLSADKESFKTVKFRPTGLSLVVGRKSPEQTVEDLGRTYNGVGKSLLITLLHFCLGSRSVRAFEESIPEWEFILRFEIGSDLHEVRRNTSSQRRIFFDGEEFGIRDLTRKLGELIFRIRDEPSLSFRSSVKRYVRPVLNGYASFDVFDSEERPFARLLNNAYVLGLNTDLIQRKKRIREEIEKRKALRKQLEDDDLFRRLLESSVEPTLELQDIKDEMTRLEKDLGSFVVADNYSELQSRANETKVKLKRVRNEIVARKNAITRIDRSLRETPDISVERIGRVFREASERLGEMLEKELQQVQKFHQDLQHRRQRHLANEKQRVQTELLQLGEQKRHLSERLDGQLAFLNSVRALDEFVQLNNRLADLRSQASTIGRIVDERRRLSTELVHLNVQFSEEAVAAEQYLSEIEDHVSELSNTFRSIAKRLYPDSPCGLTITSNDGEDQIRFDLDAHIQNDASTGINAVKLFAFDLTLLSCGGHFCSFLVHDNQLFSDIDPRQRITLFRLAQEFSSGQNAQYIATVNEDQLDAFRDLVDETEYEELITESEVLRLTDESPESKLLGIQVDMHY